jgi:hypothetical protein
MFITCGAVVMIGGDNVMARTTPAWLPAWLREALSQPTMSVPLAGKALFNADKPQSYALARRGVLPTLEGGRRKEVPTAYVRRQLMIDDDPPKAA